MKKILIIHDRFQFKGGAERLVLILVKALQADLMTEFWTEESFKKPEWLCRNEAVPRSSYRKNVAAPRSYNTTQKLFVLDKGEAPWIVWRYFRAHFNFLFKTRKIVRQYDTIIFSGNNCLTAAFNCINPPLIPPLNFLLRKKRGGRIKKILYCHSPVRHVFDLREKCRQEQTKIWKKIIYYDIGSWGIRFIYWLGIKQMDTVIANSENIKNRLKNFIHQKTDYVVYPPIDTNKFKWLGQEDYYLSFGRVERLKRIPNIVQTFQQMPDKKLIIVSGGPDLEKVKALAQGYAHIKVVGWVSDKELAEYIGKCIATIYIPIDEDFGMSPLESNAAGKPCIGVAEGGLLETIIDKKTGKLIPAKYTTQDLIDAINWMTPEKALAMRGDCEKHAEKFSAEKFVDKIKEVIKNKITIGIDASRSIDSIQKTGVEKVSDELLNAFVETRQCLVSTDINFVFYTPKLIDWLPLENQKILKWPPKYLWTQIRLAWELLVHPPDKFFVPVHKTPLMFLLFCRDAIHRVSGDAINGVSTELFILIHDVAFLKRPELYSIFQRWYLNFDLKKCIKKCFKIFVPTQQVKNDLLKYTNVDANKVVVIHHGYTLVTPAFRPENKKKQILYIGRVEEKKNISNLIKAFGIFNQKHPDYKLILAGKIDKKYLNILNSRPVPGQAQEFQIPNSIKLLGYIDDTKKQELLQQSQCLVLISKEEGFGFPILEGWDYKLPVLASNIPVLQEVGGDACHFVNPDSIENIAQGLEQITQDKNLQDNLIKKGSERLKNFSWQRAAEKYLQEILH